MKTISRRMCGAVLGLCVLAVLCVLTMTGRSAGADDATDHANQLAQAQKEREEWQRQQEQAQREYEQRERDRQAAQDWQTQREQAQKERDDWQKQRDYQQSILDGIERVKQQRDEILSRAYDAQPGSAAGWAGGGMTVPPNAPMARPTPRAQVRLAAA